MENLTKHLNSPVDDDKKILTSINSIEKFNLYIATEIDPFHKKIKKGITVFLVDDDLLYLTALKHYLHQEIPSLTIKTFQTGESSLLHMYNKPDITILDYYLDSKVSSAENGIKILKKINYLNPETKVIMLSAQDDIKIAKSSIKNGAFEYVSKGETAFFKIKNIIMNISANLRAISKFKKKMKFFKIANLIIAILLIMFYYLSQ